MTEIQILDSGIGDPGEAELASLDIVGIGIGTAGEDADFVEPGLDGEAESGVEVECNNELDVGVAVGCRARLEPGDALVFGGKLAVKDAPGVEVASNVGLGDAASETFP